LSPEESLDEPVIGDENNPTPDEILEELRSAARKAINIARKEAQQKEEQLWARYHELTKGRRQER
tara:strand:- start:44817 stop:45011 length:195 start_codon:yes stop_codon:yes gene_type:complete